jgi:nucleotide-binding universal stress UspA family protein
MADIVAGYDGSEHAKAALATAVDFARGLGDRVVVVFGFEPSPIGGEVADFRKALEETGRKLLAEATETIDHEGVEMEALLVDERPVDALVRIGQERNARALVVGSRGEGPVTAAILGSVSHKLLHISDRPVLVVPKP